MNSGFAGHRSDQSAARSGISENDRTSPVDERRVHHTKDGAKSDARKSRLNALASARVRAWSS